MLDIAPTLAMYEKIDQEFATNQWHWFFLIQPSPFPENLILANPADFKARFYGGSYAGKADFMNSEALDEYVAQFRDEACVQYVKFCPFFDGNVGAGHLASNIVSDLGSSAPRLRNHG